MRALLVDACLFVEAFLKSDGRYNQFWKLRWTLACSVQLYIDSAEGFAQSRRPSPIITGLVIHDWRYSTNMYELVNAIQIKFIAQDFHICNGGGV